MTNHLEAPSSFEPVGILEASQLPPSDPCSMWYLVSENVHRCNSTTGQPRPASLHSKSSSKKRGGFRVKAKKAVRAVVSRVKKTLHIGGRKNRNSFNMLNEYADIKRSSSIRSSKLSRRQSKKIASTTSFNDDQKHIDSNPSSSHPSIILTSASVKGRNSQYVIHSYEGADSPPRFPVKKTVRTSHPTVSHVIERPATPTTISTEIIIDEDAQAAHSCFNDGTPEPSPTTPDFAGQVQPKVLIRRSGVEVEANSSTIAAMLNKIDGFKSKSEVSGLVTLPSQIESVAESGVSLPFMAKTPALTQTTADVLTEHHRSAALAALEGPSTPPTTIPIVPVRVPPALQPARPVVLRKVAAHKRNLTTGDIGTLGDLKQLYLPYNGSFHKLDIPFANPGPTMQAKREGEEPVSDLKVGTELHESLKSTGSRESIPDFKQLASHKEHYKRIESGIFDDNVEELPDFDGFSEHQAHYQRVESGIFEGEATAINVIDGKGKATIVDVSRSVTPAPPNEPSYFTSNPASISVESLSVPAPSRIPRPQTHPSSTQPLNNKKQHQIKRKSVPVPNYSKKLTDKPLPPLPATKPDLLLMNDNGFPVLKVNERSSFSAQPGYQRRSVNEVEAKFMREQAKKMARKEARISEERKEMERVERMKQQEKAARRLLMG